ncbi:MAG TPA: FUSC family protein [Pontibacter sp.]
MQKPSTLHIIKSLFYLNEGPWRWSAGLQAALAMGLPIGVFTLLGQQSLGLMASLGGFTGLYCVAMPRTARMRVLPFIGAGFVLVSLLGVLCSVNVWLSLAGLVLVAALSCILTLGTGLGPPGPLMFIMVAAVSGQIAAKSGLRHATELGVMLLPLLVALGAAMAYLVVIIPLVLPAVRRRAAGIAPPAFASRIRLDEKAVEITFRVVLGVAITSIVGLVLEINRSYWVMIPAIAVLQAGYNRQATTIRAVHRILGTVLGMLLFGVLWLLKPSGFWLVAVIVVLQYAVEVVVTKHYGLALIFITPVALTIATASHPESYLFSLRERVIDTLLGAAIGLVIFWADEWYRERKLKAATRNRQDGS